MVLRMGSSPSSRRTWAFFLPVLVLLALTLPHLDQGDFRTDTARYAAVGVQAWRNPACFWTLHIQPSLPYFNKPPLVFWIHGWVLHVTGISLAAARLPSIAAAALCVLLTVFIGRRLMGRATALAGGLVLALTYEFFRRTREISLDLWQLAYMLSCVACVVQGLHRRRPLWVIAAGIPLGLALLCKPLMGLLTLPLLAVWLVWHGRPAHALALFGTLAVALAVAAPWHVAMILEHGTAFTTRYFGSEIADRALGRLHAEPPWYYLSEIGRTYWPWMLALIAALVTAWRRLASQHHRTGLSLALIWTCGWFVALTLFPDKRPRYELPLYPSLALIAGYGIARLPWRRLRRTYRHGLVQAAALVTVLGLTAALLPLRVQAPPDANWTALLTWLEGQGLTRVHSAALSTNDEGSYYLRTAHWPDPVRRPDGALIRALPEHAILLYADGLDPRPGKGETLLFKCGPYCVTRLEAGPWKPRTTPPR
jgi:4-amino-4-deoxy-L-arabinose transferase-like glycosyltransferase